jgi:chaperone BCS1
MQVEDNSTLKDLLVNTTSKSIIVIEDIDCSLELSGQRTQQVPSPGENPKAPLESKVTLSGLLNFTDGLWSCCGDERIIIFTTNHIEKLDPALLRPGRMDMHIHMSYCCFETFKVLSANYLSVNSHPLYSSVQSLLEGGVLITPAQVTEVLFGNKDDPDVALEKLISHMEEIAQEDAKKTGKDAELKAVDVLMKENVEKDLKENREEPRKETHVDQGKEGKMENGWDVKKENVDILKEIVDTLKENGVSLDKMVDAFAKALPESTFCKQNGLAMALQV